MSFKKYGQHCQYKQIYKRNVFKLLNCINACNRDSKVRKILAIHSLRAGLLEIERLSSS